MDIRWLNEDSQKFLDGGYLSPGQTVAERIKIIGDTTERIIGIEGLSERVQFHISKGHISPSTPIWTNFGTNRGLPISCFGSYVPDSIEGIEYTIGEVGMMSKGGGGTAGYFGGVRGRGATIKNNGTSNGTKAFLSHFQSNSDTINQGSTRRGFFAGYQDIDHPDFEEWLGIRGEGDPIQQITWGACVSTKWLTEMREGDAAKRKIWAKVIQKRFETGLPYIFFTDNANNGESVPECYKGLGMIKASQMCTEIMLPMKENWSFVCDLLSYNDLYFEDWKDTDCVEVGTMIMDAAMTEFIEKLELEQHTKAGQFFRGEFHFPFFMERALRFAKANRALGGGRLGYHSFLQSKMIPFESLAARNWNVIIQKTIHEQAQAASRKLADMFGECEMTKGTGRRNTTTDAIAPTKSSAFIMQVSESVECRSSNYFIQDLAKGKFTFKNPYLIDLLEEKGRNTDNIWKTIMENHGSVMHLDFLSDMEKLVFKTAKEVDQNEIILQASQRQKYIDQGQSLNLFISSDKTAKDVNTLILKAHDLGLKSLYYQHNINAAQLLTREIMACASCE
jgi:ribonucleoside-diphosphate reductase alpha chain